MELMRGKWRMFDWDCSHRSAILSGQNRTFFVVLLGSGSL